MKRRITSIVGSGNGDLTYDEQKSHFTAWALMKSPLLIGTDVSLIPRTDTFQWRNIDDKTDAFSLGSVEQLISAKLVDSHKYGDHCYKPGSCDWYQYIALPVGN